MRKFGLGILALGIAFGVGQMRGAEPAGQAVEKTADKPTVSVMSLMVVREVDNTALSALIDAPGGGDFKSGVMVVGRVSVPTGNVVSVDKALLVEKFTDDRGTDLGNGTVKARFAREEGVQCYLSPDRRQATFWLGSSKLPGQGAEKLLLDASLTVQLGIGEKSAESAKLPLKLGQEFPIGALNLRVEQMSVDSREGGFNVTFSSQVALGQIKSIECTDGEGKSVAVQTVDGRRGQRSLAIALVRPVKEMSLRVVQYERIESVKLPVKLEIKVGL